MTFYKECAAKEIAPALFAFFNRHQVVTKCWRKLDGVWCVRDIAFVEDWPPAHFVGLAAGLKKEVEAGGVFIGAFVDDQLKGFAAVAPELFGSSRQYLDLTDLQVSEEQRRCGIGKALILRAAGWAKAHGARKLYISAHSSVESQAFYHAVGCVEATEYDRAHTEAEPCDCQLELSL